MTATPATEGFFQRPAGIRDVDIPFGISSKAERFEVRAVIEPMGAPQLDEAAMASELLDMLVIPVRDQDVTPW